VHAGHQIGDVAVDLEHRLDRRGVIAVHRDVGREDVAVGDLALPRVEALPIGDVACRVAVARAQVAGIGELVLADLAPVGGIDGKAVEIVDLDLDHRQAGGELPQVMVERRKLGTLGKRAAIERRGALNEIGMRGPDGVGEGLGEGDAGVGLGFD